MLLHKTHVQRLLRARVHSVARDRGLHPEAGVALANELTSLQVAVDSLPEASAPPSALAKLDPLETALDMVGIKIQQLNEGSDPSRFMMIKRLCDLGHSIRKVCSTSVEDFMEDEDQGGCVVRPQVGRGNVGNYNAPVGAPYGFGENPMGPEGVGVNDIARIAMDAIPTLVESRAAEQEAGVRRDAATELEKLIKAREGLLAADLPTENIEKRIRTLSTEIGEEEEDEDNHEDTANQPP